MIKEIRIEDLDELIYKINSLPNNYIYRGHANSLWKLESTLERVLGNHLSSDRASKFESHYFDLFKSKYKIYNGIEHLPTSKLSWLSVMQHYGMPTRLLDFTESPYVALYFALESFDPLINADLAIYALDYRAISNSSFEYISSKDRDFQKTVIDISREQDSIFEDVIDRFTYDVVWITEPVELNSKLDRQAGTFLISGNRDKRVEELLTNEIYKDCSMVKYILPKELHESVYALLRKVNINAKTIYGDLYGLAKSIKMEMQVYNK